MPSQGYRHDYYRDEQSRTERARADGIGLPRELFETFMDLLDPLGFTVDVVLETSHSQHNKGHTDLYREHIDLPVLKSILWEYEDLLLNNGCTGLAVLNPGVPQEIQFDEHKLLIVYGENLREFEDVLGQHPIGCDEQLRFLTEAEHVHSSSDAYARLFEELRTRLGMDGEFAGQREADNWGLGKGVREELNRGKGRVIPVAGGRGETRGVS